MYPEDKKTLTIARRTYKNLKFVDEQKANGADVEEFTHLLNSMLGMLICLREEYFKNNTVSWDDVSRQGLAIIDVVAKKPSQSSPHLKPHRNFSQLISNVRHAFAHNCFDLVKDSNTDNISGIILWNTLLNMENTPANRTWEVKMTESELRQLADLFICYVERVFA